jgi:hypothetical protein
VGAEEECERERDFSKIKHGFTEKDDEYSFKTWSEVGF